MASFSPDSRRLRVVFFGMNSPFSLRPLAAVAGRHEVVGLVESTARRPATGWPAGLKRMLGRPTMATWAERLDVPLFTWRSLDTAALVPFLEAVRPDVCCVASLSRLLPAEALAVPAMGFVNVHPALLPDYRGPNPWFWTCHAMAPEGGVTVHRLDDGEDTGDILRQASFPIPLGMPHDRMRLAAAELGAELLLLTLEDMARGTAAGRAQRHLPCPLRARNVAADEPLIEWETWPIERVYHVLRGTAPYLAALPPVDALRGWAAWWPVGFERMPASGGPSVPGAIGLDWKGWYAAHPDGRIRLGLRPTWPSKGTRSRLAPDRL